jgi:hypothetical protein
MTALSFRPLVIAAAVLCAALGAQAQNTALHA